MSPHETTIIALKTVTLLLGGLITYMAYKASRRTGARSLSLLAVGFGIVTLGTLVAGFVDRILGLEFRVGLLVESALVAVGFAVIVVSLYATER